MTGRWLPPVWALRTTVRLACITQGLAQTAALAMPVHLGPACDSLTRHHPAMSATTSDAASDPLTLGRPSPCVTCLNGATRAFFTQGFSSSSVCAVMATQTHLFRMHHILTLVAQSFSVTVAAAQAILCFLNYCEIWSSNAYIQTF